MNFFLWEITLLNLFPPFGLKATCLFPSYQFASRPSKMALPSSYSPRRYYLLPLPVYTRKKKNRTKGPLFDFPAKAGTKNIKKIRYFPPSGGLLPLWTNDLSQIKKLCSYIVLPSPYWFSAVLFGKKVLIETDLSRGFLKVFLFFSWNCVREAAASFISFSVWASCLPSTQDKLRVVYLSPLPPHICEEEEGG